MSTVRLRDFLSGIPDYTQGKPAPVAVAGWKLSSNESPYAPLPSVARAIAGCIEGVNRYPEHAASALAALVCQRLELETANLALGNGSLEIISQLVRVTAGDGDEVLFPWRSFEAYPMLVQAAGATPVAVTLTGAHTHDLEGMLAAITARTRLVLVCNPNNPTGTTVGADELDRFVARVPRDIVVVIDEAYVHFNRRSDTAVGLDLFRRYPNVAVMHTFSKAHGLAGLRVGYAVAHEELATALRKVAIPYGVTAMAQAAAIASFEAEAELGVRVDTLVAERERVFAALEASGWRLPEAQGNFLWFPLGAHTLDAASVFEEHGLAVRPFANEGIRATIAETEANDRILEVAASLVACGLRPEGLA